MGSRNYMTVNTETFDMLKQLTQYGTDGVYKDDEVTVIAKGITGSSNYHFEVRICGKLIFKYSYNGLFPSLYGCFKETNSWENLIRKKIKEKEIGLTFEELRQLYIKDGVRLYEMDKEYQGVKSKIKHYEDYNKRLEKENIMLAEHNDEMIRTNYALTVQIEELKKTLRNEAKQTSNTFSNDKIVSFLYSNIKTRNDLDNRHKILRKLFHPDNFHDDSKMFQLVDDYYERAKRFKR